MASPTNFLYGPGQIQDNVTSLAAGAAKVLGTIGAVGVQMFDVVVAPALFLTTGAASGTIEFYIACAEATGGQWTDGINPTSAADQSALISQARLGKMISVEGAGAYRIDEWAVFPVLGGGALPMFINLIVFNKTGQPFAATSGSFVLQYSQINYANPAPVVYA
jgi:hypothetical protein